MAAPCKGVSSSQNRFTPHFTSFFVILPGHDDKHNYLDDVLRAAEVAVPGLRPPLPRRRLLPRVLHLDH